MAPLSELGKGESTFDVNGLQITVRNLSPAEEIEAQRYARVALTEGDANDQINGLDFLDRFRMICLGYAIVQIGSTDFRGVETIETGEKLPNGVAVNIKKYEAIIEVMKSWSRPMTVAVFQRFTDHMEDIEERVEKSLAYSDDHIDGQISRVEEKLNDLRSRKAKTTLAGNDPRKEVLGVAANKPTKPVESAPAEGEPETWETVRERRISTDEDALSVEIPNEMPKGVIEEGEETKVSVEPPKSEAPRRSVFGDARPVRPVVVSDPDPLDSVESSMVDVNDPNVIEAENRRLMAERMRRVPPHVSARDVAQTLEKEAPVAAGSIGGVPVFKMPTQTLDGAPRVAAVPPVTKSNLNPSFRPAK